MSRFLTRAFGLILTIMLGLLIAVPATSQSVKQPTQKAKPSLKPVAETKLIMDGLANANFRGLERLLKTQPTDVQAWTFARGQSLLIAETANLLMIRPPKGQAQAVWFDRAMEMRTTATQLAQAVANQNYSQSKTLFVNLANSCNRCHTSFRVPVQIIPFSQPNVPTKSASLRP